MKYVISKSVAVALLTMGLVASSFAGPFTLYWVNDVNGVDEYPLYWGSNSPVALSAGVANTAGDGDLLQAVALLGGTNFVLVSATVGDLPGEIPETTKDGYFDMSSDISSSMAAAVYGDGRTPLAVVFYAGPTTASPYAVVSNATITVPLTGITFFHLNYYDLNFMGPRTDAGELPGWFVDPIPEPSTLMLVGLGLLGAVGLRRRHRS